jgi:hypothetical protein
VNFIAIRLQYAHNPCLLRGTNPSTSLRKDFASRSLSNSTAESGVNTTCKRVFVGTIAELRAVAVKRVALACLMAQGNDIIPDSAVVPDDVAIERSAPRSEGTEANNFNAV